MTTFPCYAAILYEPPGYSVIATNLPGVQSQGNTMAEAEANIRDAFQGVIQSYLDQGMPIPWGDVQFDGVPLKILTFNVDESIRLYAFESACNAIWPYIQHYVTSGACLPCIEATLAIGKLLNKQAEYDKQAIEVAYADGIEAGKAEAIEKLGKIGLFKLIGPTKYKEVMTAMEE